MEQKYFFKKLLWLIYKEICISCMTSFTVMISSTFCSVFPFTSDRDHSVHEFLFMPTFSDEMASEIKRGKTPREKLERDLEKKLEK